MICTTRPRTADTDWHTASWMRALVVLFLLCAVFLLSQSEQAQATSAYYNLATNGSFSQNWNDTSLISTDDNWSGVPSIQGFLGDISGTTPFSSVPPGIQTYTDFGSGTIDVVANLTDPNAAFNGGVGELQLTDPVVALKGSGSADAPFLLLYMNSLGRSNVTISYKIRDIETADDSNQQVALQYRLSNSGSFTNIAAGYVNDATNSLATLVTNISVTDPAWSNQATLGL